jgi:hypothetical protein
VAIVTTWWFSGSNANPATSNRHARIGFEPGEVCPGAVLKKGDVISETVDFAQ